MADGVGRRCFATSEAWAQLFWAGLPWGGDTPHQDAAPWFPGLGEAQEILSHSEGQATGLDQQPRVLGLLMGSCQEPGTESELQVPPLETRVPGRKPRYQLRTFWEWYKRGSSLFTGTCEPLSEIPLEDLKNKPQKKM